jgi:hypothetical protein
MINARRSSLIGDGKQTRTKVSLEGHSSGQVGDPLGARSVAAAGLTHLHQLGRPRGFDHISSVPSYVNVPPHLQHPAV